MARSGSSANQPRRSGVSVDSWTLSSCQAVVDVASMGGVGTVGSLSAGVRRLDVLATAVAARLGSTVLRGAGCRTAVQRRRSRAGA